MDAGMDCQDLVELVTAYLEGQLDEVTERRFRDHLAECEGCERYVEQMRETLRALGRLPADGLAPAARDRLLAAFQDWHRR
jgi:predicted anti-sigma-YlaC factor YlaD